MKNTMEREKALNVMLTSLEETTQKDQGEDQRNKMRKLPSDSLF